MFAAGLAVVLFMCLVGVGKAHASAVSCSGTVVPSEELGENELTYNITCNDPNASNPDPASHVVVGVKGYSITSNRMLNYYGTETVVLDPAGEAVGSESLTCEGSLPAWGVGCYGTMSNGNTVQGTIGTEDTLCEASTQPKFWASAMTIEKKGVADTDTYVTSEPFLLKTKPCKILQPLKKAKAKRDKVCAKVKSAKSSKARKAAKKRCSAAKAQVRRLNAA